MVEEDPARVENKFTSLEESGILGSQERAEFPEEGGGMPDTPQEDED